MEEPKNTDDLFKDFSNLTEFYMKRIGKEHTVTGLVTMSLLNLYLCANFTEKGLKSYLKKCLVLAKDMAKDFEKKMELEKLTEKLKGR